VEVGEQERKDGWGREILSISTSQEPQPRLVALVTMSLFQDWLYSFKKSISVSQDGNRG
jgi:hypothetical protein